jgi:hypothetical protein
MMKRLYFVIVSALFTLCLQAQAPFPTQDEVKQFFASKTCFVLEDDPFSQYNVFIKNAVKGNWTLTPFEVISVEDFNVKRLDPAYSFVVLTETYFNKDKSGSGFTFINLLLGKDVNKLGEMPEFCAIPLAFVGTDDTEYAYKLGIILTFIQQHTNLIAEDPSIFGKKYLKYYNKFVPEVVNKTVLVTEEDMDQSVNSDEKIKKIYPYNIKVAGEDEIKQAISSKAANTLILHKVGPVGGKKEGYCFKMLIGTDDSKMYYYNQHLVDNKNPNCFLPSDLKRLARF